MKGRVRTSFRVQKRRCHHEEADDHGQERRVVRKLHRDEARILTALEWANWRLNAEIDPRVTESEKLDNELVHTVDVRHLEGGRV